MRCTWILAHWRWQILHQILWLHAQDVRKSMYGLAWSSSFRHIDEEKVHGMLGLDMPGKHREALLFFQKINMDLPMILPVGTSVPFVKYSIGSIRVLYPVQKLWESPLHSSWCHWWLESSCLQLSVSALSFHAHQIDDFKSMLLQCTLSSFVSAHVYMVGLLAAEMDL